MDNSSLIVMVIGAGAVVQVGANCIITVSPSSAIPSALGSIVSVVDFCPAGIVTFVVEVAL